MRLSSISAISFLAIITFTSGCSFSRVTAETGAPLYDPKTDLRFDYRLLGVWLPDTVLVNLREGEGNTYLAKGGGLSWLVILGDAANKAAAPDPIHLVKIGKYEYFFAAPKSGESGTSLTGCCKVECADDRITLHGLNLQAVADDLMKHPDALKHEWKQEPPPSIVPGIRPTTQPTTAPATAPATQPTTAPTTRPCLLNGDLKITDDPPAIRAYIAKHQDDADFFSDPVVLYRIAK